MGITLEQFAKQCHDILADAPGPDGREQVKAALQVALMDDAFVAETVGPDNTEKRKILYEDPELGFCILGHVHDGAAESKPHDHGPAWAIYGQAAGETAMTDWRFVEEPAEGEVGKVEAVKSYSMKRGDAHIYHEGELHSPSRTGPTRLVRIEGTNMDNVPRVYHEVA